jgi:hypothetical protein
MRKSNISTNRKGTTFLLQIFWWMFTNIDTHVKVSIHQYFTPTFMDSLQFKLKPSLSLSFLYNYSRFYIFTLKKCVILFLIPKNCKCCLNLPLWQMKRFKKVPTVVIYMENFNVTVRLLSNSKNESKNLPKKWWKQMLKRRDKHMQRMNIRSTAGLYKLVVVNYL